MTGGIPIRQKMEEGRGDALALVEVELWLVLVDLYRLHDVPSVCIELSADGLSRVLVEQVSFVVGMDLDS